MLAQLLGQTFEKPHWRLLLFDVTMCVPFVRMLSMILWVWPSSSSWTMWPATWVCCGQFRALLLLPISRGSIMFHFECQTPSFTSQLLCGFCGYLHLFTIHKWLGKYPCCAHPSWGHRASSMGRRRPGDLLDFGDGLCSFREARERGENRSPWGVGKQKPHETARLGWRLVIPLFWNAPQRKLWFRLI